MQNTRLYIEGQEVELDESVKFAITKQFEDLSDPTAIKNDWSKTVSVPFTASNNRLFGHIYDPNRVITVSTGIDATYGIFFDPSKKMNFRLDYNGDVIMQGYAKMTSVTRNAIGGTYNITLNGELGRLFQEMKKITFDRTAYTEGTEDYDKYVIDGAKYFYLDEVTGLDGWKLISDLGNTTQELKASGDTGYKRTDIIGYTLNNSFIDKFDYKSYDEGGEEEEQYYSHTFADTLKEHGFEETSGMEASTAIDKGLKPRDIGEFRDWCQIPYIYFNKLFKIFQKKAEDVTGYQFNLDTTWFNTNEYFTKTAFTLEPMLSPTPGYIKTSYLAGLTPSVASYSIANLNYDDSKATKYDDTAGYEIPWRAITAESALKSDSKAFSPIFHISGKIHVKLSFPVISDSQPGMFKGLSKKSWILCRFGYKGSDGLVVYHKQYVVASSDTEVTGLPDNTIYLDRKQATIGGNVDLEFTIPYYENVISNRSIVLEFVFKSKDGATLLSTSNYYAAPFTTTNGTAFLYTDSSLTGNIRPQQVDHSGGSYSSIELNSIWNNKYNLFDEIIKYCKMFHIVIDVDDHNKTINFTQAKNYFSGYTVSDWSNKVDYSKSFDITPIPFDSKYILFNYDDSDTEIANNYKEETGIRFGELKIATDYNFNTESKELFKGIRQPLTYTPNVLSWNTLYENGKFAYTVPNESYVDCAAKDNKYTTPFGRLYFYQGQETTDTSSGLRTLHMSSDTEAEYAIGKNMYNQYTPTTIGSYNKLGLAYGDKIITFGKPIKRYSSEQFYGSEKSIYDHIWKNYFNERYSIQNKKVTCYVMLTQNDFRNFKFNNFVRINGQLYMVNKIYDYDITNTEPTKVDLITIQNISGYTD